jgi:hypothetical protein
MRQIEENRVHADLDPRKRSLLNAFVLPMLREQGWTEMPLNGC